MKVELVGYSQLANGKGDPMALAELAASVCYDSKPTENLKIVKQCIASGHMSVLEHVSFTFHIQGISRACLAQLSRHRHISLSVRSQRYCREDDFQFCQHCGTKFIGRKNQKYCSTQCRIGAQTKKYKRPLYKKKCPYCGSEFETHNKKKM